ncbi:MAG: hypothetical protein SVW57_10255, partial [Thermodesulfobacteriota bacterium]|nr:hypothetical protein [Thermodesulfobacteriota bacterium]
YRYINANVVDYFATLKTPYSPFLPSFWATESLLPILQNFSGNVIFYQLLLWSSGVFTLVMGRWVASVFYMRGWTKSQESGKVKVSKNPLFAKVIQYATVMCQKQTRAFIAKDIMTFFRDSTQWSQLLLLLALIVVYLYNFSVLPLDRSPLPTFYLQNLISFLNMGLAGFVLSAIAVRFVFPLVSIEGRSFWILKSSPLTLDSLLWSKFIVGLLPLLVLAELLIVLSNYLLRVSSFMMYLSSITVFFMTFGITAMGIGIGAIYPRFNAENVSQVSTGFGGLFYMLCSMIFIGLIVILEAWPVYLIFMAKLTGGNLSYNEWTFVVVSFCFVGILNIIAFVFPMKLGLKNLSVLEF